MITTPIKEERAVVLDFLQHGYPFDSRPMHRKNPIAQAIGVDHFILLELVPKKGIYLQLFEEVYMGEGKRDKIHHIMGKIPLSKLTQTAKANAEVVLQKLVGKEEKRFVEFFNKAGPINVRRHQLELLPGIGKKHMQALLDARMEKPFESYQDIKSRVNLVPDPEKTVIKRIMLELEGTERHRLFV